MEDWYKDWFSSEDYLNVYNHRDTKDAQKLSELILEETKPQTGAAILDAACGAGRHASFFASKGYNVFGFDLSKTLLMKAKEHSANLNLKLYLIRTDFREICFKNQFDIILNLFTSFGYFESDEENFNFIQKSINFLKKEGYYIFDYLNKVYLENNLVGESEREIDGLTIYEKRRIEKGRVIKEILLNNDGKENFYIESVKLYDYKSVVEKFFSCGYKLVKAYGDEYGADFDEKKSPRMILILKK